jgi:hypothetical protein
MGRPLTRPGGHPLPARALETLAERGARGNALPARRKENVSCVPTVGEQPRTPRANAHLPHPFLADRTRSPSPRVPARFSHRDAGRRWPAGRMRGKVHDKVHDKVRVAGAAPRVVVLAAELRPGSFAARRIVFLRVPGGLERQVGRRERKTHRRQSNQVFRTSRFHFYFAISGGDFHSSPHSSEDTNGRRSGLNPRTHQSL